MVYGTRAKQLGSFQVKDIPCPYCEQTENQNVSIFGRYAHVMWIPLFPIGKTPIAECTHCKRTYESGEFSEKMHLVGAEDAFTDKQLYYGIMGAGAQFMLVKTPTDSSYSTFAKRKLLYDFYGPVPPAE